MKAKILVIEYEPRYVEHVHAALVDPEFKLEIATSVDEAVDRCARFEPALVIITSVLPNLTVEDAITQLRARAGLRTTPFLIVMSGYRGDNPKGDAVKLGAQDILPRPFSSEALLQQVEDLIRAAPTTAATQAIPHDMLEALRRTAGMEGEDGPVTSADLFGDILSDMESGYEPAEGEPFPSPQPGSVKPHEPAQPSQPTESPRPPDSARSPEPAAPPESPRQSSLVDDAILDMLEGGGRSSFSREESSTDADVDKLLADTLPGLDLSSPMATESSPPPAQPAEAPNVAEEGAPVEPPTPEPAVVADPAPTSGGELGQYIFEERIATFGQYIIEERIASGGMADVYKARMMGMEGFQKTVAIKRILSNLTDNEEFVRMFIDEAKLAAQLNHNNIIHIYDLGKVDRSHYIAMEFIEGRDLRSILSECNDRGLVMPVKLALHITNLLASALDYAHKKRDFEDRDLGLVHRDVSPSNVLISNDGDVKLCDFGIAKAASKATETRGGALKGKLQYMSPEQAWGKDIDHRSDIFSLGLVLYEMLTSVKVFSGHSELSVLEQVRDPVITAPSSKNSTIDQEVDQIIFLALNPDREQRYQSADELQQDVEKILRKEGWTPDRTTLAAFLDQLDGGADVAPSAPAADESAAPVGAPPLSKPPQGPPDKTPSVEPPRDEASDDLFVHAESLESAPASDADTVPGLGGVDLVGAEPAFDEAGEGGGKKHLSMLLGLVALVVVVAGGWWLFGRNGPEAPPTTRSVPITIVSTETPTPEPTTGLLSDEELIESAREAAAAEIAKQEEDLRRRLEEEFPTPTPIPPTVPPTPTETATPTPPPTSTAVPPTATRPPPTATPIPPTPTPSVREGGLVTAGMGVIVPVVIFREQPVFPSRAQAMQVEGVVEAEALVGFDGAVEEVRILSSSRGGVGFEKAAEDAIMKWRFKPATKLGVKVRMWVSIRIPFRLR